MLGQGQQEQTERRDFKNISLEKFAKSTRAVDHKAIEHILHNPFYAGKIRTGEGYMTGKFHQPLIGMDMWNKVQNLLKQRNRSVYYLDKPFFAYRKMVCCTCGRGYCPYLQEGIIYYLSKCKPGCQNPNKNIRESDIDEAVNNLLSRMHFTDKELKEVEA